MLDGLMREQLLKMLTWQFGLATGFQVAAGHFSKHLKNHIAQDLWELVERTYSDARPEQEGVAIPLAARFGDGDRRPQTVPPHL
jgi:hypothetical protein